MIDRIACAPGRPARRVLLATLSALAIAACGAVSAQAQQTQAPAKPAPKPAAPAKPAPSQQQRPAQTAPAQQAPAAQAPAPQQQQAGDMPTLIYSPWAKFCNKGQDPNAKQVCFTGRDARTESGIPVVAAALIEPEGEPKKIFRVTVPGPIQLQYGTRIIIDQNQPLTGPFFTCFANGCMADYDGTPDLVQKLKKGQTLSVQAINLAGTQISFPVPLAEFAKANEGPPTDPKVFEEQQKKLQEELQKRAEDARKKLEAQGGAQQPAPPQPPKQ